MSGPPGPPNVSEVRAAKRKKHAAVMDWMQGERWRDGTAQPGLRNLNAASYRHEDGPKPLSDIRRDALHTGNTTLLVRDIEAALVKWIGRFPVVVGCVAYLTNPVVLKALAKCKTVSIVVQKADFLRPDGVNWSASRLHDLYAALPANDTFQVFAPGFCTGGDETLAPVMCVGTCPLDASPSEPKLHHKFFVGGEMIERQVGHWPEDTWPEFRPLSLWTGSFNPTETGTQSLDNAIIFDDQAFAAFYAQEYRACLALAEPIDWKSRWVAPVFRYGT